MIPFSAAYHAARRAMAEDQRRGPRSPVPLWRLLAGEIGLLARRVGRWRVVSVAVLVAGSVLFIEIALSDSTPGPSVTAPWRWIVAAGASALTVCIWAVLHALRSTRDQTRP